MFGRSYFGVDQSASDGFDVADRLIADTYPVHVAIFHEKNVDGWSGDTGFYTTDIRSPLPSVLGQSKTWRFYLWVDPGSTAAPLFSWGYDTPAPAFDKILYTLTYVRAAQGITGEKTPVGTSVNLNHAMQGTWLFPRYTTTDGRTGYVFELTATVIPEPSSLLALFSGLAGVGFAVRRKRK
jgi:hypothetical protein